MSERVDVFGRPLISKFLYQLIIRQLMDDGFPAAARAVSDSTLTPPSEKLEKNRLANLVTSALRSERAFGTGPSPTETDLDSGLFDEETSLQRDEEQLKEEEAQEKAELDLDSPPKNVKAPKLESKFNTLHKAPCRVATFSGDGKLVATGSGDASIKVLDVQKMIIHGQQQGEQSSDAFTVTRPVIRTFYDHTAAVSDLDFHPRGVPLLISCSKDCTIKFFDISKASNKRSFRLIQDTHPVRSIQFHPTGDFILAGTDHHMIRLYDVQTFACFTSANPGDHHTAPINQVRYQSNANVFASCSKDGSVKLWDAVVNRCIRHMGNTPQNAEITSVRFSRSGQYLLTCGKDLIPRLWEVATGRQVVQYNHQKSTISQINFRAQAIFSPDEQFVYSVDDTGKMLSVWDAHTGGFLTSCTGHHGLMRWISSSPTSPYLMTCGEDHHAKFWTVTA